MKSFKYFLKFFFILSLTFVGLFFIFLIYASRPGISSKEFPEQAVIEYPLTSPTAVQPGSNEIKVVTLNMGYASGDKNNRGAVLRKEEIRSNLEQIGKVLKKIAPDILLLQEVDFHSRRSLYFNQMEFLAKGLGMNYGAYAVTWNKNYVAWPYWPLPWHFGRMVSGQAVLSRFPIKGQDILKFPKPKENPFWYNWFYLDRLVQRLEIISPRGTMEVYNLHLEAFSSKARRRQWTEVADWILVGTVPIKIVGGDFNLRWGNPDTRSQLQAFSRKTGLRISGTTVEHLTFPSWNPVQRIDFIMSSPNLEETDFHVVKGLIASDHMPVVVRYKFTDGKKPLARHPTPSTLEPR